MSLFSHEVVATSYTLPLSLSLILFGGALVGHGALMTWSHNYWYGKPLRRRVTDIMQLCHGLSVFLSPVLLWLLVGWHPEQLFPPQNDPLWRLVLPGYLGVCWGAGFVGLPWNTMRRILRRPSRTLLAERVKVVDVADRLGSKPLGDGKYRRIANLPGNQVFQLALVERTLRLPRLPAAWDGLTILQLSDMHLCGTPDRSYFEQVMERCRELEPDVLLFTGDLVDTLQHQRWIHPLLGRLRWRLAAFGILGNHDLWYGPEGVRRRLRRLGIQVVSNTWVQVELRGEPLVVIGHEGPWQRKGPNKRIEPDLTGCPTEPFRLCLSHTPDNIPWARRARIDLMLSGHVHGGQIRLPIFGPIVMPSSFGRWYDGGVYDEGETTLHVNRGLAGKQPLRYNCRPEVTHLILRAPENR